MPELKRRIIITHDKGLLGAADDILCDDRPHKANCERFQGTLLSFVNGYHWPQALDFLRARRASLGRYLQPPESARHARQRHIHAWCVAAFGEAEANSVPQRGLRLAEEAIEAAQAAGCAKDVVLALVEHVYARPVGELSQELGGVGLTTLALAEAAGLEADATEAAEARRVMTKPLEHFRARNDAKNAAGFISADLCTTQ